MRDQLSEPVSNSKQFFSLRKKSKSVQNLTDSKNDRSSPKSRPRRLSLVGSTFLRVFDKKFRGGKAKVTPCQDLDISDEEVFTFDDPELSTNDSSKDVQTSRLQKSESCSDVFCVSTSRSLPRNTKDIDFDKYLLNSSHTSNSCLGNSVSQINSVSNTVETNNDPKCAESECGQNNPSSDFLSHSWDNKTFSASYDSNCAESSCGQNNRSSNFLSHSWTNVYHARKVLVDPGSDSRSKDCKLEHAKSVRFTAELDEILSYYDDECDKSSDDDVLEDKYLITGKVHDGLDSDSVFDDNPNRSKISQTSVNLPHHQKLKKRSKSCPTFPKSSLPPDNNVVYRGSPSILKKTSHVPTVGSIPEDREFKSAGCSEDKPWVCRHPNCMEKNQELPYLLCTDCDTEIHHSSENSGHLVFDLTKQKRGVGTTLSNGLSSANTSSTDLGGDTIHKSGASVYDSIAKSIYPDNPDVSITRERSSSECLTVETPRNAHSDNEVEMRNAGKDDPDGIYMKKAELLDGKDSNSARASKFRRKKAVKGRRHHTDDEPETYTSTQRRGSLNVDLISLMTGVNHRKSESSIASFEPQTNHPPTHSPDDFTTAAENVKATTQLRRHSMYKVNINDELITVHIPMEDGKPAQTEILAAIRNTTLRDAVVPLLERRKVDVSSVNVFLDSSNTALPWKCEIFLLGGKNLHVKDRDGESILSRVKTMGAPKPFVKPIGIYSRPTSISEPEFFSDDESAEMISDLTRRCSLPFRELLQWDVKNEHPTARNQIQRASPVSSQRSRRANNLSIDDTTTPILPIVSPHGTWSSATSEKKAVRPQTKLQLLFNPLSKDREKQDQLNELLNAYSVNGLPSLPDLMRIPGQPVYDDELFVLDAHWSSLVANASSLTKRQHDQQEAIWELLQTEVHYIRSLKVINQLFTCVLLNLQQEVLLNEIETEKLFSNLNEIFLSNCQFWKTHLLKVIESARESRKPMDPSLMKEGFKKFGENFKPYTKYCLSQKPCLDYMKTRYRDNDLFKTFVVWAEAQKQCNRLKLTDLLVKPMQRLTKYSLLLQAILRKTEDDKQRRAVLEMIGNVDHFVTHVNSELRKRHEQERLGAIISKIESYDAVEPPNEECKEAIQQYSDLNLWDRMPGCDAHQARCVIIQSGLKLKDAQTRIDVECMLFTDLLLVCKASKRMDKFKVIKPPMRVDKIVIQELKDKGSFLLLYLNEYRVPVSAYTFHADTPSIRLWVEQIKKAQDLYNEAKMASMKSSGEKSVENPADSPKSPNSFLGESLDSASISRQSTTEPQPPSEPPPSPPPQRQRSYTVGGEDDIIGEDDSLDYITASQTLKRETLLRTERGPSVEVFSPGQSRIDRVADGEIPTVLNTSENRAKLMQQSMSLPISAPHSNANGSHGDGEFVFQSAMDDEAAKLKLNQRRTSRTERRYHTADSIREIQRQNQDRDNSIHKRLSWNLGMVDISLSEKRDNLKNKTFSSDSLHSVPSSSGVSSTGSLHLSPDSEISEESETNSIKASPAMGHSMNEGVDSSLDISAEMQQVDTEIERAQTGNNEHDKKLSPDDKYSKSKSTSDIANLMSDLTKSTGKLKDGISSVELPKIGSNSKKLSYSQMLHVKKQLLLNSDLEASEV